MFNHNGESSVAGLIFEGVPRVRAQGATGPTRLRWLPAVLFIMLLVFPCVVAQEQGDTRSREQSLPTVTATATGERVRFHSPGDAIQMRLEVFGAAGERLFDSGFLNGNLLDWPIQDQQSRPLSDGSYLCVATARDLGGRQSRRAAVLTVASGQGTLEPLNVERLTAGQAQILETARQTNGMDSAAGDESLTVMAESARTALTVTAHDGRDGKVVSTQGALTLGTGNILSSTNVDHVRITEEGRVGIGTDKPEATLDVAGEIKARSGIKFSDGTTLNASDGKLTFKDAGGDPISGPSVAGTGTQNRLAKWTDNSGTLGDSVVTEATGKLGIGTVNPNYELTLFGNDVGLQLISAGTGTTTNDGFRFGIDSTNQAFLWNAEPTDMYFGTLSTERMRIKANGFIGIGTANPLRTLQIGPSADAAFSFSPSTGSPNAGFIRFGDKTGWQLHFARNRESGGGSLNSGTTGVFMTLQDSGNVAIGTTNTSFAKLRVFNAGSPFTAIMGESNSSTDIGVHGLSRDGIGVSGESLNGEAVVGSSGTGFAGRFFGDVQVNGTLTKTSGSFKIDHPLDPANKYLSHSFVESPDMMNIYNGNITTDARGNATVTLPDYFTALNRDYRYQLTVVGRFAQAIIAREIKGNRFVIKTNKPSVKVSWQVTGVRRDAYAEKHRIRVEEAKPAAERGSYLNPEVFGQPREKGIGRARLLGQPPDDSAAESTLRVAAKP